MNNMTMIGPHWQADSVAALAALCGVVSFARTRVDLRDRRLGHLDIDLCHLAMSVLMALMLADGGARWPTALNIPTIGLFAAFAVWFGVRIISVERAAGAIRSGHRLGHLVMSLAMTYMAAAMRWGGNPMSATSGVGPMSSRLPWQPTLLLIMLTAMCVYVVVELDRISTPRIAAIRGARLAGAAHTAMAAAMAYMLTMMLR